MYQLSKRFVFLLNLDVVDKVKSEMNSQLTEEISTFHQRLWNAQDICLKILQCLDPLKYLKPELKVDEEGASDFVQSKI